MYKTFSTGAFMVFPAKIQSQMEILFSTSAQEKKKVYPKSFCEICMQTHVVGNPKSQAWVHLQFDDASS